MEGLKVRPPRGVVVVEAVLQRLGKGQHGGSHRLPNGLREALIEVEAHEAEELLVLAGRKRLGDVHELPDLAVEGLGRSALVGHRSAIGCSTTAEL